MPKHAKYTTGALRPASVGLTEAQRMTATRIGGTVAAGVQTTLDAVALLEQAVAAGWQIEIEQADKFVFVYCGNDARIYEAHARTAIDALRSVLNGLNDTTAQAQQEATR